MGHHRTGSWLRGLLMLASLLFGQPAIGDEVSLGVAANFTNTTRELVEQFEADTGHTVSASFGSTGKLYAQIRQGAPFDVFMAADEWRPERLEAIGLAEPGSRFTYALGRLALWSPDPAAFTDPRAFLTTPGQRRLAMANPATAPYGLAAQQVLKNLGLWEQVGPGMARGESIAQTFQFAATRNARGAFIAVAQLAEQESQGSVWLVPADMHKPIAQQAVLLDRGRDNPAAKAWMTFLKAPEARTIIRRHGYDLVERP